MGIARHVAAALMAICVAAGPGAGRLLAAADPAEGLLADAKKAFDRKDYDRAASLAKRVVTGHRESPLVEGAWLVWIDSLTEDHDLLKAYQQCEALLTTRPDSKYRAAVLQRELRVGDALTRTKVRVLFFRLSRVAEGADVLEKVVERAPYGPLADDAVYAIAEAHYRVGEYDAARDQYDRLLKQYPDSELAVRARINRALCHYRLVAGSPYDLEPGEEAQKELDYLSRVSGDEELARRGKEVRTVMARADYETGLFYFRRKNIEGGVRYLELVAAKYPETEYADRAKRILADMRTRQSREKP